MVLAAAAMVGCNSSSTTSNDLASAASADLASSTSADLSLPPGFQALAPCDKPSDYVTTPTTIMFGGAVGLLYSPQCLSVPKGTTVTWSGALLAHPLRPSTRTPGSPIMATSDGMSVSFTFGSAGFFAYFCNEHGTDQGVGMAGVVQVTN
jgi:plastocyanin